MKNIWYLFISLAIVFTSCSEDDLEPTLATAKDVETSISNQEDVEGLVNGMYNRLQVVLTMVVTISFLMK
ncbi:hypothetical protein [Chondrinema litorale]|uniref:hypothetical protein n=1 Tax=Chondrinema litorale TaxID=2994555 RepID=UPI002543D457|nr:hypothetical protein [Chondrinema litorale]UZR94556.1 hypothetical protein OQ292_01825 [Chondrinema litorale]